MLDFGRLEGRPQDLIIVGAGGLAAEGLWVAESMNQAAAAAGRPAPWNILGCCVYDPGLYPDEILSYRVLGTPQDVARSRAGEALCYMCSVGDNRIREQEVALAESFGWQAAILIHPSCQTAPNAVIGRGTYLAAGSVVCSNTRIGCHVVINNHVSVGHDSVMGDFSQACPGSRISGKCKVGRSAFLGTNATLLPGVTLGERAVLGANSVAICDVEPDVTVVGIPAKTVPRLTV
jgi:sugar O-acyltransferase (sialic acid O-acetyltransferase NeuD family)